MNIGGLEGVKTQMRMQKPRRPVELQLRCGIKKFHWNTVSREKAEVATVLFARFIFRHRRRKFGKILALAQACGDIEHLAVFCLRYLRGRPLWRSQENVTGTNSQRLSELILVLLKILLRFHLRHGQPRSDLLFNPSFAANLLCYQPRELRLRNTAATQGRTKLAFVAKLMF